MADKFVWFKMPDTRRVGYVAETFGEWGIVLWRTGGALHMSLIPVSLCSLRIPDHMEYLARGQDDYRRWWGQHSERALREFTDGLLVFARVGKTGS